LYERELRNKSIKVYDSVTTDIENGHIKLITNKDLIEMDIKGLLERYKREYEYLFDMGELYAVSLAKAMGVMAFLSDDTKEDGPHDLLVRELIEDVIPFAFYELLFLRYLSSEITLDEMYQEFQEINSKSIIQYPMNFRSRMLRTVRRFSGRHGTERDYNWICEFCDNGQIDYKVKMQGLKEYMNKFF